MFRTKRAKIMQLDSDVFEDASIQM